MERIVKELQAKPAALSVFHAVIEVRPMSVLLFLTAVVAMLIFPWEMNFFGFRGGGMSEIAFSFNNADKIMLKTGAVNS